MSLRRAWTPGLALAVVLALVAGFWSWSLNPRGGAPSGAAGGECAPGFQTIESALAEVRAEMGAESEEQREAEEEAEREREEAAGEEGERLTELQREAIREMPVLGQLDPELWDSYCLNRKRPESLNELSQLNATSAISRLAPTGAYRAAAGLAAVRQAKRLDSVDVAGTSGRAQQYGRGPLIVDGEPYTEVNGLGLDDNMGRIDSYAFDAAHGRIFAAVGNGGIWMSEDKAGSWRDISRGLPTTVTGAVGYTPGGGGTVVALTGEPTFGSSAYTGLGAYWTNDLGKHWHRADGVPAGALGFSVATDPGHKRRVYAGTQKGLFVSHDAGRTFRNVKLPTGPCKGVMNFDQKPECALANAVTDVTVVTPGGVDTETPHGTVVAAVGWRGGQRQNADGSVQSPNNGIYRSKTGAPGTFTKVETSGFAAQDAIGRVEFGSTTGPEQDHDILYAMVQDANLLNNGGVGGIDVPAGTSPPVGSTVLNGLYVSTDFGTTWSELTSGSELTGDPTTGSALIGTGTATGYQPGVQGWYNLWVQPDPSRADANGVPTRLAFGLEEIWSNDAPQSGAPLDGSVPVHFQVVAKYFGGDSCLLLSAGLPACPTDRDPTDDNDTTHPDQQDGMWFLDPDVAGGVQLIVGNDGGAYRYRFEDDPDGELDNAHWGDGDQKGFYTLMPYHAQMANDGTVYAGLQDNGNLKIDGKTRKQYETYGGDGFFAAVDPFDSNISYEEYTNGAISVTTDGGSSWASIDPGLTASKFSNPFTMDPTDAKHLLTAGREVVETTLGASTTSGMTDADAADASTTTWLKVFDLGTASAPGDAAATATATDPNNSMSAVATRGNASYVGYCGQCDTLNKLNTDSTVFRNGLATNVGGSKAPKAGTTKGWHIVDPKGLPNRYITSIAIDPQNAKRIFVTLGGYTRRWVPPGATGDVNKQIGRGHLFVSEDAGKHFTDVTGNLPDAPATWVTLRKGQLLVGTDVGAFATDQSGTRDATPRFTRLKGLPAAPVGNIALKPDNPNLAVLAMFGRGVWTYAFDDKVSIPTPTEDTSSVPPIKDSLASYDFEGGLGDWTTEGAPFTWSADSPGHGAGTEEAADGTALSFAGPTAYQDNADGSAVSPAVTVPAGKKVVQWFMKLDTEGGFDLLTLEYSTDGGTTWATLGTYSGKNADNPGWSRYRALLTSGAGDLQVRFHFVSDSLCSNLGGPACSEAGGWDGVHVDDVSIGTP